MSESADCIEQLHFAKPTLSGFLRTLTVPVQASPRVHTNSLLPGFAPYMNAQPWLWSPKKEPVATSTPSVRANSNAGDGNRVVGDPA